MDRMSAGEELELEATCRQYPEFDDDLRELWGTLIVTKAAGNQLSSTFVGEDEEEPPPVTSLELPYNLGKYQLEEEIGRGGMGIVYRATRKSDKKPVAIKMILAGDFASVVERQRFQAEAEAAAHLDHPNITPIFEIGEWKWNALLLHEADRRANTQPATDRRPAADSSCRGNDEQDLQRNSIRSRGEAYCTATLSHPIF